MIKNLYIGLILAVSSCILFSACQTDDLFSNKKDQESLSDIAFEINFPNQLFTSSSARTRTQKTESIEKLDILAYSKENDEYKFDYRVTTYSIEDTEIDSQKKVTVKLPTSDKTYQFIVLANVDEELLEEIQLENNPKTVLEELVHHNGEKWEADSPIPMWGETDEGIVVKGLNTTISIKLLRMLGRIDLLMDLEDQELFTLQEVWLYNTYTSGHIVPSPNNLNETGSGVETPTLPSAFTKTSEPLLFEAGDDNYVRGIYLYELEQDAEESRQTAPCLIIGGMYAHDIKTTYYRVNIYVRAEEGKEEYYPDILRNYLYYIKIKEIYGKGYDDKETALISVPALSGELLEINQGDSNIFFDGDNYMAISEDVFEFPKNEILTGLRVTSTLQWNATIEEAASEWLKIEEIKNDSVLFRLTENNSGETRQGHISIKAGDFRQEVLIIQTTDDRIALSIRDRAGNDITELTFSSHIHDLSVIAQELNISWAPATSICIISSTDGEVPFVYGDGSALIGDVMSAYGGSETFRIFPKELTPEEIKDNPYIEKIKYLDFMVTDGSYYSTKRVTLRQINYAILVEDKLDEYTHEFIMGKPYSIRVNTNTEWFYSVKGKNMEDFFEYAQRDGNIFNFKIKDNTELYGEKMIVTLYSTNQAQYFAPIDIEVKATKIFPNCYIMKTGSGISIPIAHVYDVHEKWLGTTLQGTVSSEIIWKDKSGQLLNTGYSNGSIWVSTYSQSGNAVIAAKINGEIIWSWHIWITDYDPDSAGGSITYTTDGYENTFMRRNLGATNASANQVDNMGFYYQWGRKDPFPGSASTTTNGNHKTIYDKNDNPITVSLYEKNEANNLGYSIQHPLTFLTADTYPYDWFTNSKEGQNNYLWDDENNYKTIFDPCPEGWRVPYISEGRSPWSNAVAVTNSSNGVTFSQFGHYPLAGKMNSSTGKIEYIPVRNFNWLGTIADEAAHGFTAGYFTIDPMDIRYRANGQSIRCVKEK